MKYRHNFRIIRRRVLEVAIVENIQRDDLNPMRARGYELNEEFEYDHESISKLMSKSRSHINTLELLTLPKDVISMLEEGTFHQVKLDQLVFQCIFNS